MLELLERRKRSAEGFDLDAQDPEVRVGNQGNHGKTMRKPWENHGETRKIIGKPWENNRKTMGKPGKSRKTRKLIGKPWENQENHRKTMGKPWENQENQGKPGNS